MRVWVYDSNRKIKEGMWVWNDLHKDEGLVTGFKKSEDENPFEWVVVMYEKKQYGQNEFLIGAGWLSVLEDIDPQPHLPSYRFLDV